MKKILGLDLGTNSIGWAFIHEAENEKSNIVRTGVRIVPLTSDEENDFKKGNKVSTNAERTLKRGARRGLQRFKQRRNALLHLFKAKNFIKEDFHYVEEGKKSTFLSYALRSKAALEAISKEDLVRVLLMLNKKRGYKSNRKTKSAEEGQAIDTMSIAKQLIEKKITPGQWIFDFLQQGGKIIPDFYRSDLQIEVERIVDFQSGFYPDVMNKDLLDSIKGKNRKDTADHFTKTLKIELAENKGTREQINLRRFEWRSQAIKQQLSKEELAYVLSEINGQINQSSAHLGMISDRSKELYFNKQTVGQYLYKKLEKNPHAGLKNLVFYRQDYIDEFEKIWEVQSTFHPELSDDKFKKEIRDITIFYQRRLKSQKHLISDCEFEKHHKTIPKSSPLFQEFRMWQNINSIIIKNIDTKEVLSFDEEVKLQLAERLNYTDSLSDAQLLDFFGLKKKDHEVNFKKIEGNRTNTAIYGAFKKILEMEGYGDLDDQKLSSEEIHEKIKSAFQEMGIHTSILDFDAEIQGDGFDKQPYYQFWHLLYASEDDNKLRVVLAKKFGFKEEHMPYLININLQTNYGSLSAKAIRKILPHLKDGHIYDKACLLARYNHSSSLTKEGNDNRELKNKLELLKKNSLRNPVVEKILNQMINVVNAIINDPTMGKPDEIRIELARELKANNEQRRDKRYKQGYQRT